VMGLNIWLLVIKTEKRITVINNVFFMDVILWPNVEFKSI